MSAQPRFFGAFLVTKKIITTDQLVSALIAQAAEMPTTLQIIYDSKLLSADDWLKVFEYQMGHRVEFKVACQTLGLWTSVMDAHLQTSLNKTKTPLGHVLLKQQATDLATLTRALDEFLAIASKAPGTAAAGSANSTAPSASTSSVPVTPKPESAPVMAPAASPIEGSGATLAAKPTTSGGMEFIDLDDSILGDFSDFFSATKVESLVEICGKATNTTGNEVQLNNLISEVSTQSHMLKGVAVCLRLPVITELLTYVEQDCLRSYRQEGRSPTKSDLENCLRAFKALLLVRERLLKDRSERRIWEESGASLEGIFKKVLQ